MRRIAFVAANECPWGGSEALWSQSAERLARSGVEVRVSAFDFGGPVPELDRIRSAGGRIFHRRFPSMFARVARRFLPFPEYRVHHLRSLTAGADLVVISQGSLVDGLAWAEAAQAAGLRYAIIVHSATEFLWPNDDSTNRLAVAFENAFGSYFVSESTLNLCRRQLGTPLTKGRIVRNPFNVGYEANPRWPHDSEGLNFACVGRLEVASKGQDVLLEMLALRRWRERNVRVSFVGSGPHSNGLARRADELGLASAAFIGHQTDIESVWSRHHALVLPSRFEGMPLVVVEAMLCGRPCVVTDVGGCRELVRDGINGFLAKAATVELLDEAMERAWENRHRLQEMGQAAARDVRAWVSPDPVADFVHELECLTNGNAPAKNA